MAIDTRTRSPDGSSEVWRRHVKALGKPIMHRFGAHATLIAVILAVGAAAALRSPLFLTYDNLIEILRAISTYFIIACPLALLMIAGGLDFSVGATFSVGAVVACGLMAQGVIWPVALLIGVVAGTLAGTVSGLIVVYLRVPPIIATLSVLFAATGLINIFVKGLIAPLPTGFLAIGQSDLFGVPLLVWEATAVGIVFWVLLEKTRFGYDVRAVGGNRDAANACGVRVRRIDLTLYALCGGVAALAGILYAARTSAGQPDAGGAAVALQVITAVLVGGVSLSGGIGSIGGVALGSLLFGEMQNALGIANFDQVWSDVFIGVVLASAVALDGLRRRRRFVEGPADRAADSAPNVSRLELLRLLSGPGRVDTARIAAAVTNERKRIERDLHDGAQQQLVNAALILQLATDQLGDSTNENLSRLLRTSAETVRAALEELRNLSRGIYPILLSESGLVAAVNSLARRSTLPVDVRADEVPRAAEHIEVTAYFVVAEALTNVLKHADASGATVTIDHDGSRLTVSVTDDGVGGIDESAGTGIRGLRDRVDAMGGHLSIHSPKGGGTSLTVCLPTADDTSQ